MYYSTHQPKAFYQTPQEGGSHTQLNHIPNHAHDQKSHSYGLRDAEEFALVGCRAFGQHPQCQPSFRSSAWVDVGGWSWWADIRLLHLVMNWRPSLTNSRGISNSSFVWSILCFCFFSLLLSWFSGRGTAMSAGVLLVGATSGVVEYYVCRSVMEVVAAHLRFPSMHLASLRRWLHDSLALTHEDLAGSWGLSRGGYRGFLHYICTCHASCMFTMTEHAHGTLKIGKKL